jgi:hypothetical protein
VLPDQHKSPPRADDDLFPFDDEDTYRTREANLLTVGLCRSIVFDTASLHDCTTQASHDMYYATPLRVRSIREDHCMENRIQKGRFLKVLFVAPPSHGGAHDCNVIVEYAGSYFRAHCIVPMNAPLPFVNDMFLVKNINENDRWASTERWVNLYSDGNRYTLSGLTRVHP